MDEFEELSLAYIHCCVEWCLDYGARKTASGWDAADGPSDELVIPLHGELVFPLYAFQCLGRSALRSPVWNQCFAHRGICIAPASSESLRMS